MVECFQQYHLFFVKINMLANSCKTNLGRRFFTPVGVFFFLSKFMYLRPSAVNSATYSSIKGRCLQVTNYFYSVVLYQDIYD